MSGFGLLASRICPADPNSYHVPLDRVHRRGGSEGPHAPVQHNVAHPIKPGLQAPYGWSTGRKTWARGVTKLARAVAAAAPVIPRELMLKV